MTKRESHDHLYNVSIEEIDFSETALKVLRRRGMTSIGDCIDFYRRGSNAMVTGIAPFFSVMANEVKDKLKGNGYGAYIEDDSDLA